MHIMRMGVLVGKLDDKSIKCSLPFILVGSVDVWDSLAVK